jgi:penicillin amidase
VAIPRVEIIVDHDGVPHIYGATDEDAFYGAGYQMASDRLFQMDQTRRRAHGRMAEVLGQVAVEDDELARLFDWPGWGRKHTDKMIRDNPSTHVLIQAWVDGVNARIAEVADGAAPLPYGFGPDEYDYLPEPWEVADVMTIATMTGFGNDLSFDREAFAAIAMKLFPEAVGAVDILQPVRSAYTMGPLPADHEHGRNHDHEDEDAHVENGPSLRANVNKDELKKSMRFLRKVRGLRGIGSNNWAVSGQHTANGRPLLAGDPHLGFDVPGLFYALHINSKDAGGSIDAAGFSFVGTPGISVGQTDAVVWTPTTAFADVMDVWTVQMPDPDHVIIAGQRLPVTHTEELITVRGLNDAVGEGNVSSMDVLTVPGYGVILPNDLVPLPLGEPGDRLLMNWIGFRPNSFDSLLDFNRVHDVREYETAVDGFGANFNFVAADAEDITYRVGARVPRRDVSEGRTPWLVLDADDPKSLWTGEFLPTELLPKSRGADRGFVSTANNDPFGFTADGRVDNDPWYYGAFYAPGWRAGRIESQLSAMIAERSGEISFRDMQDLQTDVHSSLADDLVPLVQAAYGAAATDPSLSRYADDEDIGHLATMLGAWDRQMRRDSPEALVMHVFSQFVTSRTLQDDISLLYLEAMNLQPVFIIKIATMALTGQYEHSEAVVQEGTDAVVLAALQDTAGFLRSRYGAVYPPSYRLADFKLTSFDGATGTGIDRGLFATDGGESSINVAADHGFFDLTGKVRPQSVSHWGPTFRHIATFDEAGTPQIFFNIPMGNVADPSSPHWQDLQEGWIEGEYRKLKFERDEIEDAAETRILPFGTDE